MKRTLLVIVLAAMSVGAQARHVAGVGIGGGVGGATSGPSGSQGNGQYGSRYSPGYTLGDEYRAWPEAEMKQYAKPKFVPYDGK